MQSEHTKLCFYSHVNPDELEGLVMMYIIRHMQVPTWQSFKRDAFKERGNN